MNTHVTATIDELKGRRAALAVELAPPKPISSCTRSSIPVSCGPLKCRSSVPRDPISLPGGPVVTRSSSLSQAKARPAPATSGRLDLNTVVADKPDAPLPDEAKAYLSDPPNNLKVTPCSPEAVKIGLSMKEPFTPTDLSARLDGDRTNRAYQWIAQWKNKEWILTVGFGTYRRLEGFGQ